jgi:hypothetical protein
LHLRQRVTHPPLPQVESSVIDIIISVSDYETFSVRWALRTASWHVLLLLLLTLFADDDGAAGRGVSN